MRHQLNRRAAHALHLIALNETPGRTDCGLGDEKVPYTFQGISGHALSIAAKS
jgi:hypothetical protein